MSKKNQASFLNGCKSLCYIVIIAVPTILLDGLLKKPAKMLLDFLINALFITVLFCFHLLQCLVVVGMAGGKLVIDLVDSLGCGLFGSYYRGGPDLSTALLESGQDCLTLVKFAIYLPFGLVWQLTTQVFGTIGSACHAMYAGGRLVWDAGANVLATFSPLGNSSTADGLRVSDSDQKPEQSDACRKNSSAAVWGDERLTCMKGKGFGSIRGQGLSSEGAEDKKISLGHKKTPYMDVRWLYTQPNLLG